MIRVRHCRHQNAFIYSHRHLKGEITFSNIQIILRFCKDCWPIVNGLFNSFSLTAFKTNCVFCKQKGEFKSIEICEKDYSVQSELRGPILREVLPKIYGTTMGNWAGILRYCEHSYHHNGSYWCGFKSSSIVLCDSCFSIYLLQIFPLLVNSWRDSFACSFCFTKGLEVPPLYWFHKKWDPLKWKWEKEMEFSFLCCDSCTGNLFKLLEEYFKAETIEHFV